MNSIKVSLKIFFTAILSLIYLSSCSDSNVDYLKSIPSDMTIPYGGEVPILQHLGEDIYIIPETDVYWSSTNDNVATIENLNIVAMGIGSATISFYEDETETKLITRTNITVTANYSVELISGQTIPLIDVMPEYATSARYFTGGDSNIASVSGYLTSNVINAYKPGTTYMLVTDSPGGWNYKIMLEVIVKPYTGSVPFDMPDVTKGMTTENVKQLMSSYNLVSEGYETIKYVTYYTLTYQPYGNSQSIKFYLKYNYLQETGNLETIQVLTSESIESIRGYIYTNNLSNWRVSTSGDYNIIEIDL